MTMYCLQNKHVPFSTSAFFFVSLSYCGVYMVGSVSWWLILGVSTFMLCRKESQWARPFGCSCNSPMTRHPGFVRRNIEDVCDSPEANFVSMGMLWTLCDFVPCCCFFFARHFFPRRFFQKQSFHVFLPDACFTSQHASRILIPIGSKTMSYNELLLQRRNLCFIYIYTYLLSMYMRSLSVCTCFKVST